MSFCFRMGVGLYFKKKGKPRKFWLNLKGWQKGAIIGLLIGLILGIIFFIGNLSSEAIIQILFVIILPFILIGAFIGFLTSIRNKSIKRFGIIGGIFGIFITIITLTKLWHNYKWLITPVINLLKFMGDCSYDCDGVYLILLPINFIIYTSIGLLIGLSSKS